VTSLLLDLLLGDTDGGYEVSGPPQRWVVPANWKLPAENLAGDGYHVLAAHRSLVELGLVGGLSGNSPVARAQRALMAGRDYDPPRVSYLATTDPERGPRLGDAADSEVGLSEDEDLEVVARLSGAPGGNADQLRRNLSSDQLRFVRRHFASTGTLFPNLSVIRAPFTTATDAPPVPSFSLRLWCPRTVDSTQVLSWVLVPRDASDEVKDEMRRSSIRSFGAAGLAEQDDVEVWSRIQSGARGCRVGSARIFTCRTRSRWPSRCRRARTNIGSTDDSQWNFYLRWRDLIGGAVR